MESRVRALTREIGTLKEDLKRESKRKERAVERCKVCDEALQLAEQEAKELRYSNRKLADDLASTRESSRQAAANNHKAIQSLQDGLSNVEQAVGHRAAQSYEKMQAVYSAVQKLQAALFSPGSLRDSAAAAVQASFADLLQQLSHLSGQLACGTDGLATMLGSAGKGVPEANGGTSNQHVPSGTAHSQQLRAENESLRQQLGHLQAHAAGREAADPALLSTVAQVESLIPHYRQALEKLKNQAFSMKDRLEQAAADRKLQAEQVAELKAALREQDAALQAKEAQQAEATAAVHQREAHIIAVSTEAETSRIQLEVELQELYERFAEAESRRVAACTDYESRLKAMERQIADEQRRQEEQQLYISELQGKLSEQQVDIKAALDLVLSRRQVRTSSHEGSSPPLSQSPTSAAKKLAHHISQRMSSSSGTAPFVSSTSEAWPAASMSHPPAPVVTHQGQGWHRERHQDSSDARVGGALCGPQRRATGHLRSPKGRSALSTEWPQRRAGATRAWPEAPAQSYGAKELREHSASLSLNPQPSRATGGIDMAQLRREMASLDCEIAGLETSLKEAASKFT